MHFAIVGADGRFTMRATEALRDELQLECTGDWFPADPDAMVFARGRQDVRLVLRKAARLRVGLPGLPAGASLHLYVECVSPGESKPVFATRLRADTRELDVPAGTWDLVIRLFARECDEVHRIERVVADAGVENHDPRLMELQWQKFLQPVTVRVVGPDGQPTDQCTIWQNFRTRSGTEGTSVSQTRDGIGRLLVPKGGSHVVVRSRNQTWRQADLGIVEADVVARLTQAPRIAVSISAMPDLPEGAILQAMLVAEEGMKADWPSASFDADGKCALLAPATGPFRLQITVRRGNTAKTVGSDGQVAIEVGDRDLEHRFELTEALRRSIAEAAREP
jgi:hypothetical protein